jgi:hypothetical protein
MPQVFTLMSGSVFEDMLTAPDNLVAKLPSDDPAAVDQLYWSLVGRSPTVAEQEKGVSHLASGPDRRKQLEDIAWHC